MNFDVLLILFSIFGLLGIVLFFIKSTKSLAYASFSFAFFLMGLSAIASNEPSALAAFLLSLIASRKVKINFDRK